MTGRFPDFMVDVETTGTQPDRTAMIQLAAVRFNLAERTIDTTSMFNQALFIPPHRFWDEDTRGWWGSQKPDILDEIFRRMRDPQEVMWEFFHWTGGFDQYEAPRFWAKPTSFDFSFVASYFKDYGISNPFSFRQATDLNSFIRGLARDSSIINFKSEFPGGDAHNAIFDCIAQIDNVFKAMEHYAAT